MRAVAFALAILATILTLSLASLPSHAQVSVTFRETWVSSAGADHNPCSRSQPCRTLERAHELTSPGGRIGIIDAGNYGGLQITKAISIINDGSGVAILSTSQLGGPVRIAAGANDQIHLRGLTIDGSDGGIAGINFGTGGALHIQNSVIKSFRASIPVPFRPGASEVTHGIRFAPAARSELYISDTLIIGNGNTASASYGILIQPGSAGLASAVLNRVQLENNLNGLGVDGSLSRIRVEAVTGPIERHPLLGVHVSLLGSVIAGHAGIGVMALSTTAIAAAGVRTVVVMVRSASLNNGVGLVVDGLRASLRVSESTITGNGTGLLATNNGRLFYSLTNSISENRIAIDEPPSNQ